MQPETGLAGSSDEAEKGRYTRSEKDSSKSEEVDQGTGGGLFRGGSNTAHISITIKRRRA